MLKVKFKYRDRKSNWQWREQECIVSSIDECIKIYGLGIDCDYKILSVTDSNGQPLKNVQNNEHIYYSGNNKTKKTYDDKYKGYGTYRKHCCLKKKGW